MDPDDPVGCVEAAGDYVPWITVECTHYPDYWDMEMDRWDIGHPNIPAEDCPEWAVLKPDAQSCPPG